MRLEIIQGDDYKEYLALPRSEDIVSATCCMNCGSQYMFPLTPTDEEDIWELEIPSDVTSLMYIGDFRCYVIIFYKDAEIQYLDNLDTVRINYKWNKTN